MASMGSACGAGAGQTPIPLSTCCEPYATDVVRRIFPVHEVMPVAGGAPLVLLYPQWLPGNHAPEGRIDLLGGLELHAGAARVEWTRDPSNV